MKIVQPTTSEQEILIIPRKNITYTNLDFRDRVVSDGGIAESQLCVVDSLINLNAINMVIKKDGEAIEETLTNLRTTELNNYIKIQFTSTILQEGHAYFIELTENGNLLYRDKFYATTQADFTTKHKQSQNNYTEIVDDNTYIL